MRSLQSYRWVNPTKATGGRKYKHVLLCEISWSFLCIHGRDHPGTNEGLSLLGNLAFSPLVAAGHRTEAAHHSCRSLAKKKGIKGLKSKRQIHCRALIMFFSHLQMGCHPRKTVWMSGQDSHGRRILMTKFHCWQTQVEYHLSGPPLQTCRKLPFFELSHRKLALIHTHMVQSPYNKYSLSSDQNTLHCI